MSAEGWIAREFSVALADEMAAMKSQEGTALGGQ
jgi:hypothetical protein